MKLAGLLKPMIAEQFEKQCPVFHGGLKPLVTFPPRWPGFGTLALRGDRAGVMICFGGFTHCHVGNFDNQASEDEKAADIVRRVVSMLGDVYADRIEFFLHEAGGVGRGPSAAVG